MKSEFKILFESSVYFNVTATSEIEKISTLLIAWKHVVFSSCKIFKAFTSYLCVNNRSSASHLKKRIQNANFVCILKSLAKKV